jgi:hypothetical protein
VKANSFAAVSCELLSEGFAVGKDEVVVDVCDHYENSGVVRTIWVKAIMGGQRRY